MLALDNRIHARIHNEFQEGNKEIASIIIIL